MAKPPQDDKRCELCRFWGERTESEFMTIRKCGNAKSRASGAYTGKRFGCSSFEKRGG